MRRWRNGKRRSRSRGGHPSHGHAAPGSRGHAGGRAVFGACRLAGAALYRGAGGGFGEALEPGLVPAVVFDLRVGQHVAMLQAELQKAGVAEQQLVDMAQGNKQSRFIAWTFLTETQQQLWRQQRAGKWWPGFQCLRLLHPGQRQLPDQRHLHRTDPRLR